MATEIKIGGEVPVLTDKGLRSVEWIEWDGRAWLADLWIVAPNGRSQKPLRIIAPKMAPGFPPIPGPEILAIFAKMPIPESLLESGYLPPELAPLYEVRESPDIWAAIHDEPSSHPASTKH